MLIKNEETVQSSFCPVLLDNKTAGISHEMENLYCLRNVLPPRYPISKDKMVKVRDVVTTPVRWWMGGVLLFTAHGALARSYRDIELVHSLNVPDLSGAAYLELREMAYKARSEGNLSQAEKIPTVRPGERQTSTIAPSPMPSHKPTPNPTLLPTTSPTLTPTDQPTAFPTSAPTPGDPYPPNEPPLDPEPWYFNYDTSPSSEFGPGSVGLSYQPNGFFKAGFQNDYWGQVASPPDDYWIEFTDKGFGPWKSVLEIHDPKENKCTTGMLQSPIDLRINGATCREHHEVRSLPGDFQVTGRRVEKRIESNKLRLVYERRPCSDLDMPECQEPDPPYVKSGLLSFYARYLL